MIHPALSKAEIAFRYYKIVKPDKGYSKIQAKKLFHADNHKDLKTIRRVINKIFKEQDKLLKP